jgi:hypothetical protein
VLMSRCVIVSWQGSGATFALRPLENRRMRARTFLTASALVIFALGASQADITPATPANAANKAPDKAPAGTPVPVETSMHDFMEGVFQGPYRRLKVSMAAEPKDNAGWKAIRGEALILAEGGNLLLLRKPAMDAEEWVKYSAASRDAGADLFKAAKAKDFTASKKAYEAMLTHCNACHKKFDDGKNQLTP